MGGQNGGEKWGGAENNLGGGAFAPPLPLPGAATARDHRQSAVRALLHYLQLREGDVDPLVCHPTGPPLKRATLTTWFRNSVARACLPGNFSGHSFCIGVATSAAAAGIPNRFREIV